MLGCGALRKIQPQSRNPRILRIGHELEAALIAEYYGMPESGDQPDKGSLYRVQTGAYGIKANADKQLAKLRAAGFDAFISS